MHSRNVTILDKIIYVNIGVFILINLIELFSFLMQINIDIIPYLGLSANISVLIEKPWTIISYMFSHQNFSHILLNLFWLYFSGKIFIKYIDKHELLATYVMSGFSGLFFYLIAFNLLPVFTNFNNNSIAIGASASVLGILFASATHVPNFNINLYLIPAQIKLKHIAIIAIIIDIISIPQGNAGGHIAHLGGAIYGFFFIKLHRRKINANFLINKLIIHFNQKKNQTTIPRRESDYEFNARKKNNEKKINKILDKINLSGYDSLSIKEKEYLHKQ